MAGKQTTPDRKTSDRKRNEASLANLKLGGGRPKGVPNKVTLKREKEIAEGGLTPLEYMLGVLRDDGNALDVRLDAAKSAAPYCHPKLAQIAHTGPDGGAVQHTHEVLIRGIPA
jgi:hypothetical protein